MDVIQLLQRFEILDIPPREILNACREGLTLLESLGLFQGTDVNDTNPSVKQAHRLHQPGRILPSACLQPPGQEGDDGGRHLRAMEIHYDFTSPPGSPCTRGSHLVVLEWNGEVVQVSPSSYRAWVHFELSKLAEPDMGA